MRGVEMNEPTRDEVLAALAWALTHAEMYLEEAGKLPSLELQEHRRVYNELRG